MSLIMKNLVKSYYDSANELFNKDKTAFAAPIFVLRTFAAELSLKWLIKLEKSTVPKSHNFEKLFTSLSSLTQVNIVNRINAQLKTNYTLDDFKIKLDIAKDYFIDARYIYDVAASPTNPVVFDYSLIEHLCYAAIVVGESMGG